MTEFNSVFGKVVFSEAGTNGCCGVGEIFGVSFAPQNRDNKYLHDLFTDFHYHLLTNRSLYTWRYNKLFMTDGIRNDGKAKYDNSIAAFCRHVEWEESSHVRNKNSSNHVLIFSVDRPVNDDGSLLSSFKITDEGFLKRKAELEEAQKKKQEKLKKVTDVQLKQFEAKLKEMTESLRRV